MKPGAPVCSHAAQSTWLLDFCVDDAGFDFWFTDAELFRAAIGADLELDLLERSLGRDEYIVILFGEF